MNRTNRPTRRTFLGALSALPVAATLGDTTGATAAASTGAAPTAYRAEHLPSEGGRLDPASGPWRVYYVAPYGPDSEDQDWDSGAEIVDGFGVTLEDATAAARQSIRGNAEFGNKPDDYVVATGGHIVARVRARDVLAERAEEGGNR